MKKSLLVCLMAVSSLSSAQISYSYGWEPTGAGSWTSSGSGSFARSTTTPCAGSGSMRANNYYNLSSYLVSPALTGTNGGDLTVNFNYKVTQYSSNTTGASLTDFGYIKLEWATNSAGPWTTAYTIDNSTHAVAATCASKSAVISGIPASGDVFIRFDAKSGLSTSDNYVYFDDVSISQGAPPACVAPGGITVSSVTASTATVSWTASSSSPSGGYDLYYSTSSVAPLSTTAPNFTAIAGTTQNLTTLTPGAMHYVWVRSSCAGGKSTWSPVNSFLTSCLSTSIPYTLDFEAVTTPAIPVCTAVVNNGTGNTWNTYTLGGSGFVGNVLNYSYNTASPADTWFFTQGVNLTAGTSYRIKYKYGNASAATYPEKLKVAYGASASSAAMTSVLADYPNVVNSTANSAFVDFTPTTTGVFYFGFQAYSAADMNRLYVDDINIDVTPLCTEPTAVIVSNLTTTGATLAWTAPSSVPANGYNIYYSTTNTAPTATTSPSLSVTATTTTTPLTPLTPATTYYVWVRSNCGTAQSVWTSMVTFATPAPPPANDNCGSPTSITPGAAFSQNPVTGTTVGATLTSDATATTACQTTRYADTWYTVVVPASGSITIETKSATGSSVSDTVLGIYTGSCGALTSVGCNDDDGDGNFSMVTLTSANGISAGQTLLVGVWNYSATNNGAFQISAYDASLSTSEVAQIKNNLTAYPNPFADVLNISDVKNVKSVSIVDIAGRLVKTIEKPSSALQLGELKSGMYVVILNMNDGTKQTIKAIKK